MRFSLATWNIGGGILGRSHQYGVEAQLDYYAGIVRGTRPDILCLQECHEYARFTNQARQLAESLGYSHFITSRLSASHLAAEAWLSLAVLSNFQITSHSFRQFPSYDLTSIGPNGHQWELFDKGYLILTLQIDESRELAVVNGHCYPLHHFDEQPTSRRFRPMWQMLRRDLQQLARDSLTVVALDLNYPAPEELLGDLLNPDLFRPSFLGVPTKPSGIQHDFIFYGPGMLCVDYHVEPTNSDHSYCFAELEIAGIRPARRDRVVIGSPDGVRTDDIRG